MKTTLMTFFIYSKHKPQQQELLKLHIAPNLLNGSEQTGKSQTKWDTEIRQFAFCGWQHAWAQLGSFLFSLNFLQV